MSIPDYLGADHPESGFSELDCTAERFDDLVNIAIDQIPEEFFQHLGNVIIQVASRHPEVPDLLGLYEGIPLTERGIEEFAPPDHITLYREALLSISADEQTLIEQIRITLLHEIGHFFGLEEDDLDRLGYA